MTAEQIIQKTVMAHIRERGAPGLVSWHTPNGAFLGGNRGRQMNLLKSLGLRPGVSDVVSLHHGKFFALELKAPKGTPSEEQLEFIADVQAAGGYGVVAEGLDEAVRCLEFWGLLRGKAA